MGGAMSDKEPKDYWSECEQGFCHYGKGYGLMDTLQTICLGSEINIPQLMAIAYTENRAGHIIRHCNCLFLV